MSRYHGDDDDMGYIGGVGGTFRIPDKDVYRRTLTTFGSVHNYFKNRIVVRNSRDQRMQQPHFSALKNTISPFAYPYNSADGICAHFLRRGLIKPNKTQMNTAIWSPDARWLVLGTINGDLALWEGDTLKVHKVVSLPAHKRFDGEDVTGGVSITAMAWNRNGNLIVSGDNNGLIQYCDETFREVKKIPEAHAGPVRGLSFSPLDSKVVSCSDDKLLHIWAKGESTPELVLAGHEADVRTVDWHPYRSLIASGSRDTTVRLWDPRVNMCVSQLLGHKKPVNCCSWNKNGNWLASGSKDGLIKVYDIRVMKETEVFRGHNSDVCSMTWHPQYENLLASGGYNGSIIYWLANHNQAPHTIIADAHRQSVDIMAYHPAGHCLATASHDGILKFWSREPPGSTLTNDYSKDFQDNPVVSYGPLSIGAPNIIPVTIPSSVPGQVDRGGQQQPQFEQQYRSSSQQYNNGHGGGGNERGEREQRGGGRGRGRFQREGGRGGGAGGADFGGDNTYMPKKRQRDG